MKKAIIITALIIIVKTAPCFAGISIESYSYLTHYVIRDVISCSVTVKNNQANGMEPYILFAVTKSGVTTENYSLAASPSMTLGETRALTASWNTSGASAGIYSVTLKVYEDSLGVAAQDTEYGNLPIVISGTSTRESLSVFPTVLDLGTIPNGRYMYPAPIQVSWDFFLFDRLRQAKPWFIRIYTDNATKYKGVPGVLHPISPAGLVSSDGRYTIPLKAWCLNFGPDTEETGWDSKLQGAPTVDDDIFWLGPPTGDGERLDEKSAWLRVPDYTEMTADIDTWRKLIGEDITDTQFVSDVTADGAFTLNNPFSVYLATDASTTAVKGDYSARIIIELYSP